MAVPSNDYNENLAQYDESPTNEDIDRELDARYSFVFKEPRLFDMNPPDAGEQAWAIATP